MIMAKTFVAKIFLAKSSNRVKSQSSNPTRALCHYIIFPLKVAVMTSLLKRKITNLYTLSILEIRHISVYRVPYHAITDLCNLVLFLYT